MQDNLTKLGNEEYLKLNYYKYIQKNQDANYIMIDLTMFKKINDSYGHEIGDRCLIFFADSLTRFFKNALLIRLHGDEFVIVTDLSENAITEAFENVDANISLAVDGELLPLKFGFNAGISQAFDDLELTNNRADCMMYYAKTNGLMIQPFSTQIYDIFMHKKDLISSFNTRLKLSSFSYYGRKLFKKNNEVSDKIQIYTKDENGKSVFEDRSYQILRESSIISKFDLLNLKRFISDLDIIESNNAYFLNIDYRSLFSISYFNSILEYVSNYMIDVRKLILSIDMSFISTNEYKLIIKSINKFKSLGFQIRLDKLDDTVANYLIKEINPEYIKLANYIWKKAMVSSRESDILSCELNLMKVINPDVVVIFEQIENEMQNEYIKKIAFDDSLFSGDLFSKEKKLILK